MSLSLTHNHIHRHTIILSRSMMLALIHYCNQLSPCNGLTLSLSAYVTFGAFIKIFLASLHPRIIVECTFLPLKVRCGQVICFGGKKKCESYTWLPRRSF